MKKIILFFGVCLCLSSQVFANNNFYIQGDAFFYFEIDNSEWKKIENSQLQIVEYDRPEILPFMLCGYAGYKKLDISKLPREYRTRITQAIEEMKQQYPTKIQTIDHGKPKFFGSPAGIEKKEINKIRIFVYHRDFDFSKYRIGLKYNESWPEAASAWGHSKEHFQYDFFVNTPKAITESWRFGSNVGPLTKKVPLRREDPLELDHSQVKFLIAPPIPLQSLCYPPTKDSFECIVVSPQATKTIEVDKSPNGIWKYKE